MMKARFEAVLFDLDGTLLDTAPDFATATNILLRQKKLPQVTEQDIRRLISDGSAGIISKLFAMNSSNPQYEKTRYELLNLYSHHLADQTLPFRGLVELLKELDAHDIPWGIVTNKPEIYTNSILKQLDLASYPKVVVCPDHVKLTKPNPEPIILACNKLGIKPENTVYIGDHIRDIQAGANAGAVTIAAAYGYIEKYDDISKWHANFIANQPGDLLKLIFP